MRLRLTLIFFYYGNRVFISRYSQEFAPHIMKYTKRRPSKAEKRFRAKALIIFSHVIIRRHDIKGDVRGLQHATFSAHFMFNH